MESIKRELITEIRKNSTSIPKLLQEIKGLITLIVRSYKDVTDSYQMKKFHGRKLITEVTMDNLERMIPSAL